MIARPPFTGILIPSAGGGASNFVFDTFTESSDMDLALHTGELGAVWTEHPHANYTVPFAIDSATDRIFSTGTAAYYASGLPPSANYFVQADIFLHTAISQNLGIAARMDTVADTMYYVRLNSGTTWELRKIVAGTQTTLGTSTNQLPSAGTFKTVKLVVSGTSISVFINGVLEIGPITDSSISSAGRAGIRNAGTASATTGIHIDNFSAQ